MMEEADEVAFGLKSDMGLWERFLLSIGTCSLTNGADPHVKYRLPSRHSPADRIELVHQGHCSGVVVAANQGGVPRADRVSRPKAGKVRIDLAGAAGCRLERMEQAYALGVEAAGQLGRHDGAVRVSAGGQRGTCRRRTLRPASQNRSDRCGSWRANSLVGVSAVHRYYDPTTGDFLTVDPDVAETQQPYYYAGDNPK